MKKIRAPQMLLVLILALSLFLPFSVHALSQDKPERHHTFMLGRFLDFLNFIADLDLTDDQKTTLKDLFTDTHDNVKPLIEQMKNLRDEMDEAILAEKIDAAKATDLNEQMIAVKSNISDIVLNAKLEGAQVLTPEQRAMILEKKKEHRERMEEWRDRFKGWRDFFSKLFFN